MAKAYLAEHRQLMVEAKATVERWTLEGVFGKRARRAFRANLSSDAQTPNAQKSITSAVQNSGAEWSADQ
jgi:hypothetical protein